MSTLTKADWETIRARVAARAREVGELYNDLEGREWKDHLNFILDRIGRGEYMREPQQIHDQLGEKDWVEIYYALETVKNPSQLIVDIMDRIGPDGQDAFNS